MKKIGVLMKGAVSKRELKILIVVLLGATLFLAGCVSQNSKNVEDSKNLGRVELEERAKIKEELREEFVRAYNFSPISNREVKIDLEAREANIEVIGKTLENAWTYNGSLYNVIRIKLGDTLVINFTNNLEQETTIHFHGIRVPNAMDGVPGVTQPPINPGEGFLYKFKPKDPGTYWFHPHIRGEEQLEKGLYGVIVVEDNTTQYYDKDEVVILDDWLFEDLEELKLDENFKNMHAIMMNGRIGNVITANAKEMEVINLKKGERLRLRIVNTANARVFVLSGNKAYVIAVDGFYVREPFPLSSFDFAPGNRVDLDIIGEETFYIYDEITGKKLIMINVSGKTNKTQYLTKEERFSFINQYIPTLREAFGLDEDYRYDYSLKMVPGKGMLWAVNGVSWPDYIKYTFNAGEFNIVKLKDNSGRIHPIHFHGLFFKVISRNGEFVDEGFYRDTVTLYPYDEVVIGLVPLDKGKWVNHCHIQEHAENGFMTLTEVI